MSNNSLLPWKRLITEGAVIVGSILLAFAIDAWWDGHKDADDLREILSLIKLETDANLTVLADSTARHVDIHAAIETAKDARSIATVYRRAVIQVEVFEPTSNALNTLVSTGMLGLIDDLDLRVSLMAIEGLSRDLAERELAAVSFRNEARRRVASLGVRINEEIPLSSTTFTDIEVLNLLTMRAVEEKHAIDSGRKLMTHLQSISAKLDALSNP